MLNLTNINKYPKNMSDLDHRLSAAHRLRVIFETAASIVSKSLSGPENRPFPSIWKQTFAELSHQRDAWRMHASPYVADKNPVTLYGAPKGGPENSSAGVSADSAYEVRRLGDEQQHINKQEGEQTAETLVMFAQLEPLEDEIKTLQEKHKEASERVQKLTSSNVRLSTVIQHHKAKVQVTQQEVEDLHLKLFKAHEKIDKLHGLDKQADSGHGISITSPNEGMTEAKNLKAQLASMQRENDLLAHRILMSQTEAHNSNVLRKALCTEKKTLQAENAGLCQAWDGFVVPRSETEKG
ncbi:hypothetical protein LX32DRAFT_704687 [Colletotrichum zoysiae]|uniref:Uncharacterized protein n=1 Tax=Colletotrichum zoysiae TaxID=1216348 RepID=A0AAD9HAY7_9PEZI|nr:hypothetical protein LX32DRAFT_704687 [Colletotrichum zoysiae]